MRSRNPDQFAEGGRTSFTVSFAGGPGRLEAVPIGPERPVPSGYVR